MRDPNPINNGKGIKKLQRKGIKVTCGVLEKEAMELNRVFKTYITKKIDKKIKFIKYCLIYTLYLL